MFNAIEPAEGIAGAVDIQGRAGAPPGAWTPAGER